jgi:uncharacterized damage-inducible protein DinB
MTIAESFVLELDTEARATRRVLERVPHEHLGWRPHQKSMTLGQLAQHVATIPGGVAEAVGRQIFQLPEFAQPTVEEANVLVPMLDENVKSARAILQPMDDPMTQATWRIVDGDREVAATPRATFVRNVMFNHWYHHRDQLTVYLRQLGVPVPSIYGPSADENPFAAARPEAAAGAIVLES